MNLKALRLIALVFAGALVWGLTLRAEPAPVKARDKQIVDFNRDIRPILSDNCYFCHGPDKGHRKGDPALRLDTKDGLFGEREGTHTIVPGSLEDSVLYQRITSDDPDFRMPHKDSNKKLTAQQIDTLKRWIEQGAPWKDHWAYIPPTKPEVPETNADGPHASFVRNPIDRFILAKLEEHKLAPAPEADRVTLVRRLYLDLLGMPPTPEQVDSFVNNTSRNAYESLVDQLLASPHFGERMAVHWLDLVRYADSIGYHSDNPREVWPYRDWVIKAFNSNKPFDQFTVEQIAGDLLPNATRDQKIASAYNRLLETTGEGGAQAKEYIVKYQVDRVRNVSSAFMGSTMGCCQCHDHKFDPFTAKDFYSMSAFFADIQEPAISLPTPELLLPDGKQEAAMKKLDEAILASDVKLKTTTTEIASAQAEWEKKYHALKQSDPAQWTPMKVIAAKSEGGAKMNIWEKDPSYVLATGTNPETDVYTVKATTKAKGITAIRMEAVPHASLPGKGPGRAPNGNFVFTELDVQATKGAGPTSQPVAFDGASASTEQKSFAETTPYRRYPAFAAIDNDKFGDKLGWAILPRTGVKSYAVFQTASDIGTGEELELTFTMKQKFGSQHNIGHFRLSVTNSPRPIHAVPDSDIPADITVILDTEPAKRTKEQNEKVAAHYRSISPALAPVREAIAKLNKEKAELVASVPKTLISVSGPRRPVRVLPRGDWLNDSGEIVEANIPAFLAKIAPIARKVDGVASADPKSAATQPALTRLDLANWLVSKQNPLTARVFVNRLWKLFYGQGLAKPLDDIGSQGDWPTHPELLDYLACEFQDCGWDVKHMVRLLVTSGTYRQSSTTDKQYAQQDPFNKYVERQGAFRLDAEFVRDNALTISGLLVSKIGGPPVKPYQPEGYWDFLNFPKRTYQNDHGESQYRRGVYTHWQRTFLHPSMSNFDASGREECVAQRSQSNTPQQALTLLNDPTYVEAARVFAARIIKDGGESAADKITWAYRHALSREPRPQEVPVLTKLLEKHRKEFATTRPSAEKLISAGEAPPAKDIDSAELAGWTSVARVILNLHETITRN
jgi:hypothetical protein